MSSRCSKGEGPPNSVTTIWDAIGVLSVTSETVLETVIDLTLGSFVGIFLEILRLSGMRRDMHEASSMKEVSASLGWGRRGQLALARKRKGAKRER